MTVMFDGVTYDATLDEARLTGQLAKVRDLMADGNWRLLSGIAGHIGAPEASISARLRDLRKPKFGGFTVERQRFFGGLYMYRVLPPEQDGQLSLLEVSK